MKQRFIQTAGCLTLLVASAAFGASMLMPENAGPGIGEKIAAVRAERKARPRKAKAKAPVSGPQRVYAGSKPLYGVMYHTEENPDYYGFFGPVQISATGDHTILSTFEGDPFSGCYFDGKFLQCFHEAVSGVDVGFMIYDATTWEPLTGLMNFTSSTGGVADMLPYSLAYDHTSNRIYGCFFADSYNWWFADDAYFGYIDFDDNPLDPVTITNRELPERMRAMVFDKDGQLHGLAFSGQMYTINKYTGEATPSVSVDLYSAEDFASDPFSSYGRESMACDWETGDFYLSYSDGMADSYIAKINPTTGESEIVADYSWLYNDGWLFGDVFTGLYFIQESEKPADIIPAVVTDLTVTPEGTQLKANVSFKLPVTDSEGEALDTDLTWIVSDGSAELGRGTAHTGETVTTTVDILQPGLNQIVVTTSLNDIESRPTIASAFFGTDTPVIPGLPTVRAAGSRLTVTWSEAYALNNGNLDPVTYKVVRMPDEKVVAEAVSETSLTDELESEYKTLYYYIITPKSGAVEGEPVNSRSLYAGKYLPFPYFDDFTNETLFMEYPVIDANDDYNVWEYSYKFNGVAMYPANTEPADDYLLIGPFKMAEGGVYSFHAVADGHNMREQIGIYVGTDPDDVNTFSHELVAPTDLNPMKGQSIFDVSFEPTESGDYYFAVRACTPYASQFIYLYEIGVKALGGAVPDAPKDFNIVPALTTATVNFTLPETNIDGTRIEALTEARIYRDGALIGTITENLTPGAPVSFTDEEEVTDGFHSYSAVALSAEGEGKSENGQIWRGLDMPGRPSNLRFWEDLETPGLMHATFNHPERGYYGGYVNPDDIEYHVDYLVMGAGAGDIYLGKGTDHTFNIPVDASVQNLFAGSLYGSNSKGAVAKSGNWLTQVAFYGPAIGLPISESWSGQTQRSGIWGGQPIDENEGIGDNFWDVSSGSITPTSPQDNDAGMLALSTTVENGGKRILSPRFTVEGAENPALVFYYNHTPEAIDLAVEVIVDDQPVKVLKNLDINDSNSGKWTREEISLSEFKNSKYLQIAFTGHGHPCEEFAAIDNLTISNLLENNLTVKSFTAPEKTNVNEQASMEIVIRNNGSKTAKGSDYELRLFKNGELLDQMEGTDLEPDATTRFVFSDTPTVTDPETNEYYVEVEFAADENKADNTTPVKQIRTVIADYPTVSDLKAEEGEEIRLTWDAPDSSLIPGEKVTENFDSYDPFIIDNIGNWNVYDGDKELTVIMATSLGVLNYPNIGQPMAWQVFDPEQANLLSGAWYARSGRQMLVSFQASANNNREVTSNDWLISPELNGSNQEISFYSRAGHSGYVPELFDFMISSTGHEPEDFQVLEADVEVPYTTDSWTEYRFRVPEGTRHFAIVHKSFNKLAMLVDDITYIPAGSEPEQLDLVGFNIYRDGKRLNGSPLDANEYVDKDVVPDTEYRYNVTAVWDKGESRLSDPVTVKAVSSVDNAVNYTLTISAIPGAIRIKGGIGENVSVYNAAGACIATVKAQDTTDVPVPAAGVYIVKAPGAVAKIAVRN